MPHLLLHFENKWSVIRLHYLEAGHINLDCQSSVMKGTVSNALQRRGRPTSEDAMTASRSTSTLRKPSLLSFWVLEAVLNT